MTEKKRSLHIPGLSLLILIIFSLCMVTFSLLSLSSSKADADLSRKLADRTTAYYEAVSKANQLLSELDSQLGRLYLESLTGQSPEDAYRTSLSSLPKLLKTGTVTQEGFSFFVPVNDRQQLAVTASFLVPSSSEDCFYELTEFHLETTADWVPDTRQQVFQGDTAIEK